MPRNAVARMTGAVARGPRRRNGDGSDDEYAAYRWLRTALLPQVVALGHDGRSRSHHAGSRVAARSRTNPRPRSQAYRQRPTRPGGENVRRSVHCHYVSRLRRGARLVNGRGRRRRRSGRRRRAGSVPAQRGESDRAVVPAWRDRPYALQRRGRTEPAPAPSRDPSGGTLTR